MCVSVCVCGRDGEYYLKWNDGLEMQKCSPGDSQTGQAVYGVTKPVPNLTLSTLFVYV